MSAAVQSKLIRKVTFEKFLGQTQDEKQAEDKIIASLSEYSSSSFDAESWVMDKTTDKSHPDTVSFKRFCIMGEYSVRLVKLFMLVRYNRGNKEAIGVLYKYFGFLNNKNMNLYQVNKKTFALYSYWIDQQVKNNGGLYSEAYKYMLLEIALNFQSLMNGHSKISYIEGVKAIENPYDKRSRYSKYKVIDDETLEKLDGHFKSDESPLHFKVAYWIMRLYATRPVDTINYPLDCVKRLSDDMATIKHAIVKNSKSARGVDYNIEYLNLKEPMQKMLFELIEKQQSISERLQAIAKKKNFLLTNLQELGKSINVVSNQVLQRHFKKVQVQLSIPESKRAIPRDFKKTGITMRAESGWSTPQLKHLANHRTFDSIGAYSEPSESHMIKEQEKILRANKELAGRYMFKGKIINGIGDNLEKKLLENPRAHKIPDLGFCPDVMGCGNHLECIGCDDLIPDGGLEEYYLEQTDRYLKIAEKQLEMGDKINARDSHHRATLFASLHNKVQDNRSTEQ